MDRVAVALVLTVQRKLTINRRRLLIREFFALLISFMTFAIHTQLPDRLLRSLLPFLLLHLGLGLPLAYSLANVEPPIQQGNRLTLLVRHQHMLENVAHVAVDLQFLDHRDRHQFPFPLLDDLIMLLLLLNNLKILRVTILLINLQFFYFV